MKKYQEDEFILRNLVLFFCEAASMLSGKESAG